MSDILLSLVSFLVIISLLVTIHELGHFLTARFFKIGIKEFALGLPPRIASKKIGETVYAINALPLGGYVRMVGEDKEEGEKENSFLHKKPLQRLIVLLAGSVSHFLLAMLIFGVFAFLNGEAVPTGKIAIEEVAPNSPAAVAGLEPGDMIVALNNEALKDNTDFTSRVRSQAGEEIDLTLLRGESYVYATLTPRTDPPAGEGALGVGITTDYVIKQVNPIRATFLAVDTTWMVVRETITGLGRLLGDIFVRAKVPSDLSGPVGIAAISGEVAKSQGIPGLIFLMAALAANLAVFNLLPLPALDGGRIVFVLLEILRRGKKVPIEKEALVHAVGIAALLLVAVLITYKDIMKLIGL